MNQQELLPDAFADGAEPAVLLERMRAGNGLSQSEVGFLLGMSRQRVNQIEQRALAKLRSGLHRAGFGAEDLPAA